MAKKDFTISDPLPPEPSFCDGFGLALLDGNRILLPIPMAIEVGKSQDRKWAEERAQRQVKKNPPVPAHFDFRDRSSAGDLASIRAGTDHDLDDAKALADKVFKRTKTQMDGFALEFSKDLFVGVALYFSYMEKHCAFPLMLDFLNDPAWDCVPQMLQAVGRSSAGQSAAAVNFLRGFDSRTDELGDNVKSLVERCSTHWSIAFSPTGKIPKKKKQARTVPIFSPEAVSKALGLVSSMREDSRAGGAVTLKNAQHNGGRRTVPDARKAVEKLEAAKSKFENLVEAVAHLQTDLTLASAMPCDEFRVTPILLLGNPGIGKTFLAMQLATALGVATDKISAGGGNGGFQIAGSHSSWQGSRPGSLFTLLAENSSAAPVLVIDEVDKIVDGKHPFLPVLLDLFEPNTAKTFKDEFFEVKFDASRVIFVLTANTLDGIPASLLSRVEVFDVPRPEPAQRLRIIQDEAEQLRRKTKILIELDKADCESLADRQDVDLRKTTRLVKEAFAKAMQTGDTVARLLIPKFEGRLAVGFGRTDQSAFGR